MKSFPARLKEERKRLGLKGAEVALAAGVSREAQSAYENGRRTPDVAYLAALCGIGFDALYLLTGSRASLADAPPTLTREEKTLLENYHRASKAIKQAAQAVLQSGLKSSHSKTFVVGRDMHGDVSM